MKGILGFLSLLLVVAGLQGIVHEAFGKWIPFLGFTRFVYVDGYEIYISIALLVLGAAVGALATKAPQD
ncbi:hypothetical protein [Streptomyces boninensis]|uniref:hypothetical protein n=1 Tax=Streptomyces boninensis TaxID=2039455 RepID=UPI003B21DD16